MNKFWHDIKIIVTVFFLMGSSVAVTLWIVREIEVLHRSPPDVPASVSSAGAGRRMTVYAYCPCEVCCGKWADGYTASGHEIQAGELIVAAPRRIPFGTSLSVPGYGVASVQDRGGDITGNRLDILFETHAEAKAWGVQELMVKEIR